METLHIVPSRDSKPHKTTGLVCSCLPTISEDEFQRLVIHYAWDGRDFAEHEEATFSEAEIGELYEWRVKPNFNGH